MKLNIKPTAGHVSQAGRFSPTIQSFLASVQRQDYQVLSKLTNSDLADYYLGLFKTQDPFLLDQKEVVRDLAVNVAAKDEPVLITGPTGTGKELLARALHGTRGTVLVTEGLVKKPDLSTFIAQNCAAITDTMFEAEMFGSMKGSFTGSTMDRPGIFAAVKNGTIFLDEIGDLPLPAQAKLLRVIQEREVRPIGSTVTVPVTSRVVAATRYDLEERVKEGLFREDLYGRLSVFTVKTIGLKDRPSDIEYILKEAFNYNQMPPQDYIESAVYRLNVRALYAYVTRCRVLGRSWLKE